MGRLPQATLLTIYITKEYIHKNSNCCSRIKLHKDWPSGKVYTCTWQKISAGLHASGEQRDRLCCLTLVHTMHHLITVHAICLPVLLYTGFALCCFIEGCTLYCDNVPPVGPKHTYIVHVHTVPPFISENKCYIETHGGILMMSQWCN
jgi:hypothetical protein